MFPNLSLPWRLLETSIGENMACIQVQALLKADQLLSRIEKDPSLTSDLWHPEYAYFMIEGVPAEPYTGLKACVDSVEANFKRRRTEMMKLLGEGEAVMTIGNFPLTGCPEFT